MAEAMKYAMQAGRLACCAGRIRFADTLRHPRLMPDESTRGTSG